MLFYYLHKLKYRSKPATNRSGYPVYSRAVWRFFLCLQMNEVWYGNWGNLTKHFHQWRQCKSWCELLVGGFSHVFWSKFQLIYASKNSLRFVNHISPRLIQIIYTNFVPTLQKIPNLHYHQLVWAIYGNRYLSGKCRPTESVTLTQVITTVR